MEKKATSKTNVNQDIPQTQIKDFFVNTKKVIGEEDRVRFEKVLDKISLIKQRDEIIEQYKVEVDAYKAMYHPDKKQISKKILEEDKQIPERRKELLGSDDEMGIEEKYNIMTKYRGKNKRLREEIRGQLSDLMSIIQSHSERLLGELTLLENEGKDTTVERAAVEEMLELKEIIKKELAAFDREARKALGADSNKKKKINSKEDKDNSKDAPPQTPDSDQTQPSKGDEAEKDVNEQQQPGGEVVSVGGGVPVTQQVESRSKTKEHKEKEETSKAPQKESEKEKYLRLKSICDRLGLSEDELDHMSKEKVTDKQLNELDKEFERIHKAMLEDAEKVDKWDKRILLAMLCQERYYETTKENKRAEYHLKTRVKGFLARVLPQHAKLPEHITKHREVLEDLENYMQKDKSLSSDLDKKEAVEVIDNFNTAIDTWNENMGNLERAKYESKLVLPFEGEIGDLVEEEMREEIVSEADELDIEKQAEDIDFDEPLNI